MDLVERGSRTARDGFANERDVVNRFNNWERDKLGQDWLVAMNYDLDEIEYVEAEVITGMQKADVQVRVTIKLKHLVDCQNLQVKLVSNSTGFNQIDKRWLAKYKELWAIPDDVFRVLRLYTGELSPYRSGTRDPRRMFMDEITQTERKLLLDWLRNNRSLIVCDIIKGRGRFAAEWYLVIKKEMASDTDWRLKPINYVINFYNSGDIIITAQGNIRIGKITMQRKGGDGGRPTANMLQFKLDPTALFD